MFLFIIFLLISGLIIPQHFALQYRRMNAIRRLLPFLLSLASLTLLSPPIARAWQLVSAGLLSVPLTGAYEIVTAPAQADLDGDGWPETLRLADGQFTLHSGTQAGWQSPEAWRVVQAAFTDLDGDGAPEATLLVWRPFRPWPVDEWLPHGGRIAGFHDAAGQSCHIILIGWRDGGYRELWAGSALAAPIRAFAAADLDADGRQELAVLEAGYDDPASMAANRLTVWEWNGFGFSLVYGLSGQFRQLQIIRAADGRFLILIP
jgi:hypothetical protein